MAQRTRHSLQEVHNKYVSGEDRSMLENLIRAFRGIQKLDPADDNSFFKIAGYHGEPFRGKGATDPEWWGGYCHHGDVLFPTWHRAYLLRIEDALRSIPGCADVTLPFWDECLDVGSGNGNPIPAVLTTPTFDLDGETHNPLYSYRLQQALVEDVQGAAARYTKPAGYETVRYPLSGLVGTSEDQSETQAHNSAYTDADARARILNGNVANWLEGTVKIEPDPEQTPTPDTYSVYSEYQRCLDAPSYTVFSNVTSMGQYIKDHSADARFEVALESPHNSIHLAVGGFYQPGEYNADATIGANGDMGDNETAGFDPIFFLHHCFVDYVFWAWQRKNNMTAAGSITIQKGYTGTTLADGLPDMEPGAALDMNTPLYPFKKSDGSWYESADMVDVENQLGYGYGAGSLDPLIGAAQEGAAAVPAAPPVPAAPAKAQAPAAQAPIGHGSGAKTPAGAHHAAGSAGHPAAGHAHPGHPGAAHKVAPIVALKRVHNINRSDYAGSFVIRTYARGPAGKKVEIGRTAVLSRWSVASCANCQNKLNVESLVPMDQTTLNMLRGDGKDEDVEFWAEIQMRHDYNLTGPPGVPEHARKGKGPKVVDL